MPAELVLPEVISLLEARPGLLWLHPLRFAGQPGFPDLIICGPAGIIFREVKPSRYRPLRPRQTAWRWLLTAAGQNWAIWDQDDIDTGTVERELEELMRP